MKALHVRLLSLGMTVLSGCTAAPTPPSPAPAPVRGPPPGLVLPAPLPPRPQAGLPPRMPPQQGGHVGAAGAANVDWQFTGAPRDGLDTMRATMSPRGYDNPGQNFIYWAFQGYFVQGQGWYVGLQPSGEFGKTALFSVFGEGSTPLDPACKAGADNGAGTHCHIPYPWDTGRAYQFVVTLVAGNAGTSTWQGSVQDLATGATTVIGAIGVTAAHGYLKASGVNFLLDALAPRRKSVRARNVVFQVEGRRSWAVRSDL